MTEAAWGKAMQHAQGEKVLDDPKLLSKAIKRKEKGKQKSAQAWYVRIITIPASSTHTGDGL